MSRSTLISRMSAAAMAVGVLLVTAGCGSSSGGPANPASNPATQAPTDALAAIAPCLAGTGARPGSTGGAHPVTFATLGDAPRAVILSNQSDQDLCPWLPFAKTLARDGFRAVLYDYAVAPNDDTVPLTDYLRAHGANAVALMGASLGAKGSIMAASAIEPPPEAVVTLSAEAHFGSYVIVKFAAKLTSPVLFVSAAHDGWDAASAAHSFLKVAPAKVKKIDIVPGSAHGTALLSQPAVVSTVIGFLKAHDA